MGDREGPGAELGFVAVEAREVADDLEHHLAEQVVRVVGAAGAQVAEQGGGELGVEGPPGRVVAGTGPPKDRREVVAQLQLACWNAREAKRCGSAGVRSAA